MEAQPPKIREYENMAQEKMALIVNSASYDRVSYALSIANISAAQLKDVYVFFTYGAVLRLLEGKADEVGEETDAWVRESVKKGLENGTMQRISELLDFSKGFGVKIYACSAAVAFHDIAKEELVALDGIMGISSFLEKVQGASPILYI
jgi:peroxiredoxin family protein